jgi:hypothetical protein
MVTKEIISSGIAAIRLINALLELSFRELLSVQTSTLVAEAIQMER